MSISFDQESHNPNSSSGFLLSPQKPPFTMVSPGPLKTELDQFYEDGRPIPFFVNTVDKDRFPEVWESVENSHENQRRKARGVAISEAERNRLVKAPKCPTLDKKGEKFSEAWWQHLKFERIAKQAAQTRAQRETDQWFVEQGIKTPEEIEQKWAKKHADGVRIRYENPHQSCDVIKTVQTPKGERVESRRVVGRITTHNGTDYDILNTDYETGEIPGAERHEDSDAKYTVIEARGWDDAYRVRTYREMPHGLPPEQEGDRVTDVLSMRGASAISDSCQYMALKKRGFTTFLTLTLDESSRRKLVRKVASRRVDIRHIAAEYRCFSWGVVTCHGPDGEGAAPFCHLFGEGDTETGFGPADGPFTPLNWEYETSVQKEVSRFMDAAQKMFQRGWRSGKFEEREYPWGKVACLDRNPKGFKVMGSRLVGDGHGLAGEMAGTDQAVGEFSKFSNANDLVKKGRNPLFADGNYCPVQPEKLHYCWVAECPKNDQGEDNPHIHVLMRWRVPYRLFREWAFRLEQIWGLGFAHLEKIKDPENAGAYMAKAAGYLTKAQGRSDQGRIRGNRYGISSSARAPGWACIERSELGIMGHLIADVYDYWSHLYGAKFAERRRLNEALDTVRNDEQLSAEEKTAARHRIGRKLEGVRGFINTLPAKVSKYQIVLKGREWLDAFTSWAKQDQYFDGCRVFPRKGEGESWSPVNKPSSLFSKQFQLSMFCRRFKRRYNGMTPAIAQKFYEEDPPIPEASSSSFWRDWFAYEKWSVTA